MGIFCWANQVSAAPAFAPTDLGTNTRLWLRSGGTRYQDTARTSLVTASAQNVKSWTDSGAVGLHPSENTNPPVEPAGRDGAMYNGARLLVTPALGAFAADFFVGVVFTATTLASGYVRILERGASGAGVYLGTVSGNDLTAFVEGTMSSIVSCSTGAKHWAAITRVGTTAKLYLDSATAVDTWSVAGAAIGDLPTVVGASDGGGGPAFDGKIHEVVVVKSVSAGDITNLLAYLATV